MKLGISSYTYTWAVGVPGSNPEKPLTASDLVDIAKTLGLNLVQIADNLPLETLSTDNLETLKKSLHDNQISIEMGSRGIQPAHALECLRVAQNLGSPFLRMVVDGAGFEPSVPEIISIIRDLLPEFKRCRIKLALENHDRLKAKEFEHIVLKTDPDWVGICLDSVNSMGAGEGFETVSEILLPYTFNLHVKDFTVTRVSHKMGFVIQGVPAGKGMLNIPDLIDKLRKQGNCYSAILELWTPPLATIAETIAIEDAWARESIAYLSGLIK